VARNQIRIPIEDRTEREGFYSEKSQQCLRLEFLQTARVFRFISKSNRARPRNQKQNLLSFEYMRAHYSSPADTLSSTRTHITNDFVRCSVLRANEQYHVLTGTTTTATALYTELVVTIASFPLPTQSSFHILL
jgi:hypothetical protein